MKTAIVIIMIIGALNSMITTSADMKSTASIDGMGYYRLNDYSIDAKGCLEFIDQIGVLNQTCNAYKIVTLEEYQKMEIANIKSFNE